LERERVEETIAREREWERDAERKVGELSKRLRLERHFFSKVYIRKKQRIYIR